MESCYGAHVSATPPEAPADAPTGYPTDGSSSGGVSATVPQAFWYHGVTTEIVNAIKGGALVPDRADLSQLSASIQKQDKAVYDSIIPLIDKLNARIDQLELTPSGLIAYFGCANPPNGNWLVCDGRAVSRTSYAKLFSVIGTRHGAGNGNSTFNLPDLRSRVAWGCPAGSSVGQTIEAGLPNITARWGGTQWYEPNAGGAVTQSHDRQRTKDGTDTDGGVYWFDASRSSAVYGKSSTVQPPAIRLLPCIHI